MKSHRLALLFAFAACGGGGTGITIAGDDVVVNSLLPAESERGVDVTLRVLGSGFDAASSVSFLFGDVETDAITVTGVQFVSAVELTVHAHIKPSAPLGRYSVRVVTGRGTRGRGNEKFRTLVEMETLGDGWAYAVNLYGTIVGYTTPPGGGPQQAFVRLGGSPLTNLPGTLVGSIAYDITDADLIVGTMIYLNDPNGGRPVRWKVDGLRTVEELFPRSTAEWSSIRGEAKRANESGLIVGWVNPNEVPGGAQRAFCWRETGYSIVPAPDANYLGSGVPWDVNEAGDAVGRVVRQTPPAISQAFVLHCHDATPTITILAGLGATAHAIAEDGTVYGQSGGVTVRWRKTGPDQWGSPEEMPGVPFLPERVTAGGRLVGGSNSTAYLWDSTFGLIPLSGVADGFAGAWFARDNGPGTGVDIVGFVTPSQDQGSAIRWRVNLPHP